MKMEILILNVLFYHNSFCIIHKFFVFAFFLLKSFHNISYMLNIYIYINISIYLTNYKINRRKMLIIAIAFYLCF